MPKILISCRWGPPAKQPALALKVMWSLGRLSNHVRMILCTIPDETAVTNRGAHVLGLFSISLVHPAIHWDEKSNETNNDHRMRRLMADEARCLLDVIFCLSHDVLLLIPQFCPHRQRTGEQQRCRDVSDWPRGSTEVHVGSHLHRKCPYGPQTHNRRTRFSEII